MSPEDGTRRQRDFGRCSHRSSLQDPPNPNRQPDPQSRADGMLSEPEYVVCSAPGVAPKRIRVDHLSERDQTDHHGERTSSKCPEHKLSPDEDRPDGSDYGRRRGKGGIPIEAPRVHENVPYENRHNERKAGYEQQHGDQEDQSLIDSAHRSRRTLRWIARCSWNRFRHGMPFYACHLDPYIHTQGARVTAWGVRADSASRASPMARPEGTDCSIVSPRFGPFGVR